MSAAPKTTGATNPESPSTLQAVGNAVGTAINEKLAGLSSLVLPSLMVAQIGDRGRGATVAPRDPTIEFQDLRGGRGSTVTNEQVTAAHQKNMTLLGIANKGARALLQREGVRIIVVDDVNAAWETYTGQKAPKAGEFHADGEKEHLAFTHTFRDKDGKATGTAIVLGRNLFTPERAHEAFSILAHESHHLGQPTHPANGQPVRAMGVGEREFLAYHNEMRDVATLSKKIMNKKFEENASKTTIDGIELTSADERAFDNRVSQLERKRKVIEQRYQEEIKTKGADWIHIDTATEARGMTMYVHKSDPHFAAIRDGIPKGGWITRVEGSTAPAAKDALFAIYKGRFDQNPKYVYPDKAPAAGETLSDSAKLDALVQALGK